MSESPPPKNPLPSPPGWDRQTIPEGPHGWVQWKGTTVCMDVTCLCGKQSHIDGEFAYYVRCRRCGRTFMVNGHVELIELNDEERAEVDESHSSVLTDRPNPWEDDEEDEA